jgi:CBS domain-containing protein
MHVRAILAIKGKVLYTIAPDKSLAEAVATMTGQDIGSVVVFDHGRMAGILTFREVLQAINQAGSGWTTIAIAAVMVRAPIIASPDTEIDELRRLMVENHQRYTPVMDGAMLLGVVSFHDVAKAVLEEQGFENRMLKNYITDQPAA